MNTRQFQSFLVLVRAGLSVFATFVVAATTFPCSLAANEPFCGAESATKVLVSLSTKHAHTESLGAEVTTGKFLTVRCSEPGTGVMLVAPDRAWNLSQFVAVAIDVCNVGAKPATLIGELNGQPWAYFSPLNHPLLVVESVVTMEINFPTSYRLSVIQFLSRWREFAT